MMIASLYKLIGPGTNAAITASLVAATLPKTHLKEDKQLHWFAMLTNSLQLTNKLLLPEEITI